ncbi:MAG: bifunctional 4-hydroxy-2-oxoglutarate aldolase/2-dehydro-3-deoxy-phosphogluconate aldolase [Pseudomonadota bacterium]
MDASDTLAAARVVPVVVIDDATVAVELAATLADAGIAAIEITLRTPAALSAIAAVAKDNPGILVGAGSVRNADQFAAIVDAGARFAVSPGHSDSLLAAAKAHGLPFVPGAVTASETLTLLDHGYTLQKFFPAESAGGLPMIKALSAPLPEVRFFPTGGINVERARDYLAFDAVSAVGGSWLTPAKALASRDFASIGELAAAAAKI